MTTNGDETCRRGADHAAMSSPVPKTQFHINGYVREWGKYMGVTGAAVKALRGDTGEVLAAAVTDYGRYTLKFEASQQADIFIRVYPPQGYRAHKVQPGSTLGPDSAISSDTALLRTKLVGLYYYGRVDFVLSRPATFAGKITRYPGVQGLCGVAVEFWTGGALLARVTTGPFGDYSWTCRDWPLEHPLDVKVAAPPGYRVMWNNPGWAGQSLAADVIRYPVSLAGGTYESTFVLQQEQRGVASPTAEATPGDTA
jgi:hypothetical protein